MALACLVLLNLPFLYYDKDVIGFLLSWFMEGGKRLYKILIVDDFLPDKITLREMINRLKGLDTVISCEADNGRQAIEAIKTYEPDIVITDIEMPVCDGFELAKHIRVNYPHIRIIFSSLYEEFKYAKKALFLGGYGYLTKPVNPDELKQCLKNVMGHISQENDLLEHSREYMQTKKLLELYKPVMADHFIHNLLLGLESGPSEIIFSKASYFGIPLIKALYSMLLIEVDEFDKATAGQSAEKRQFLSIQIFEKMKEIMVSAVTHILTRIDESHFVIIMQFADHLAAAVESAMDECCNKLLMGFRKTDVTITIVVSNTADNPFDLMNLYEYCSSLIRYKFILGGSTIIKGSDVPFTNSYPDINFNFMIKDVRCLLNSSAPGEIEDYLDRLFINKSALNEQYYKNMCFMLVACAQIILSENNVAFSDTIQTDMTTLEKLNAFETVMAEKEWISNIFIAIKEKLMKKARSKSRQLVDEIIKHIEKNFFKGINMNTLSAELYYSTNYLNRIFKQEVGETIFDYAIKFRIEKTKELLCNRAVKLYEITSLMGYSNPAYFSAVFKKYTGMTPNEYRERNMT